LVNADASKPVGTAIIPKPIITMNEVNILPPAVIGYISPYPTVVKVATAHQRQWKIDLNCSGCAGFSK